MTWADIAAVLGVGTLVGLDLASVPQLMISRPLVAGFLGGMLVGHPVPGLVVGALLELFAMESLPVGAARYPDWGPGTVAVGALAGEHAQGILATGLLGLVLVAVASAWLGGWLIQVVRRANVADVVRHRAALDAGELRAIVAVQRSGLLRDGARSLALTALALGFGDVVHSTVEVAWRWPQWPAQVALVGTSVGVALYAGWRMAGRGRQSLWFLAGLGGGAAGTVLWLR